MLAFMMNCLMLTFRLSDSWYMVAALNSAVNGSGPRLMSNLCCKGSWSVHNTAPKRRGSRKRRHCPLLSWSSKWSCFCAGVLLANTRKLPDMPKWIMSVPASDLRSRYFARRSIAVIVWFFRMLFILNGIGQRSCFWRIIMLLISDEADAVQFPYGWFQPQVIQACVICC